MRQSLYSVLIELGHYSLNKTCIAILWREGEEIKFLSKSSFISGSYVHS